MSFDSVKQVSGLPPPDPVRGVPVYKYLQRLVRWCNSERILWGAGFLVTPGPHGKAVEFLPGSGNRSFTVSRVSASLISVKGGYAQTQTGTLSVVASVESVAISDNLAVFARYDLGLAGTSSPGWEVVSGSIIQTAAALPSYDARYRVVPIAAVTWDGTSSAISGIVQHHTGTLPCPDMVESGTVQPFNVAYGTVKYGWKPCDGTASTVDTQKKLISGKGSTGNLAAGAATTTLTYVALDNSSADHSHWLDYVDTVSVQPFDAGLGGDPIGIDRIGPNTLASRSAFNADITLDIIPPNVALAFYEHL